MGSTTRWVAGFCFALLFTADICAGQTFAEKRALAAKALAELRAKAEAGDSKAQSKLGQRYYMGEGVEEDFGAALKWCRLAAAQGDAQGQCGLGNCYSQGNGAKQNDAEALKWYRLAAA